MIKHTNPSQQILLTKSLHLTLGLWAALMLLTLVIAFPQFVAPATAQTKVVATVNDEPISQFDVDQRSKFYVLTSNGKVGRSAAKKRAMKELVDETLMLQEMKRLGINVQQTQVVSAIDARLAPNKKNHKWFKGMLRSRGIRISTLENRIRSQIGWRQVIQRTYSSLIDIGENEISRAIKEIDNKENKEETIFSLKKITLQLPKGAGDADIGRRMEEASKIRRSFRNCRTAELVTGRYRDVKTTNAPRTKVKDLKEPTRSLVLQAKANDMIPPNITETGIELIAVCDRKDDGGKRDGVKSQLVSQEFSMLADRHLRDLTQDAVVEYR